MTGRKYVQKTDLINAPSVNRYSTDVATQPRKAPGFPYNTHRISQNQSSISNSQHTTIRERMIAIYATDPIIRNRLLTRDPEESTFNEVLVARRSPESAVSPSLSQTASNLKPKIELLIRTNIKYECDFDNEKF